MGHPGGIHVVGNLIMSPIERSRFETLVRTHHEVVFRAAFQILRNDDEALDVTQEVFLSVLEERQRLDEADDEGRVLRWIAAKRALMLLRGASRRRQREDRNAMNRETTRDHDDVVANDEAQTLWGCVSDLPEDLRRAVVLRFQEGMTYDAMGGALSCSGPTAHDRVRRALQRLREMLPVLGLVGVAAGLEKALAAQVFVAVPTGLRGKLLALGSAKAAAFSGGVTAGTLVASACAVAIAVAGVWIGINPGAETAGWNPDPIGSAVGPPTASGEDEGDRGGTRTDRFREQPAPRREAEVAVAPVRPSSPVGVDEGPLATITGRVVDPQHVPLADIDVAAESEERAGKFARHVVRGRTDARGAYRIAVPAPNADGDAYRLVFSHADRITRRGAAFTVRADDESRRDDQLLARSSDDREGDYTLDIKAVSADGNPVPTVALSVWRRLATEQGFRSVHVGGARVPVSGVVRVEGKWLGTKIVRVDAARSGYMPLEESFHISTPGAHTRVVVMRRGLEIAGSVTDVDGAPIPNLDVYGYKDRRAGCLTDAQGRFRIVGLDPAIWTLYFGGGAWSRGEMTVAAGRAGLNIKLKRKDDPTDRGLHLAELHGHVEDAETGERLALDRWGFDLDVRAVPEKLASSSTEDVLPRFLSPLMAQRAQQGQRLAGEKPPTSFHKDGLPPGAYVIDVRRDGYAPCLFGPVRLGAGELRTGIVMRLERPAEARGRVLAADGNPVAGAFVFTIGRGPASQQTLAERDRAIKKSKGRGTQYWGGFVKTDDAGYFALGGLPASLALDVVAVHLDHEPAAPRPAGLTVGQQTTGLDLRMGAVR
ncbi:MAG: hypothetical protein CMJ90_08335 [Planctomycetes bacterium]|nr:hypothetical protein [Planctomycetota bacterium]